MLQNVNEPIVRLSCQYDAVFAHPNEANGAVIH